MKKEARSLKRLFEHYKKINMKKKVIVNVKPNIILQRNESRADFSDISHRLEAVAIINGVEWINDSKSTDIGATCFSLETIRKPIIWIVGSNESKRDLSMILKLVRLKVCKVICYGKFDTAIKYSLGEIIDHYAYKPTLEEAVEMADLWSKKDDAVLFSPACPSFENFENYKMRGNHFKDLVKRIEACN